MARIAVCPAGHPLGMHVEGAWTLRHHHRSWRLLPGLDLAEAFDAVECERCRVEYPADALDVHEYAPAVARVA